MAAYDAYRSQPDPSQQQSYPSSVYDPTYDGRPYQSSAYSGAQYQDSQGRRSRASSSAPSEGQQPVQQPLNNALNNAFDKSDAARTVDPDLIAQITAEVKRSVLHEIKSSGVGGATGQPQPPPQQQYVPQSPTSTSASFPPRNVYTPPSPHKHPDFSSQGSASPEPPLARDSEFDGTDDTPTPRYERNAPADISREAASKTRPAGPTRMETEPDFTPIEKMWQRLFDAQGTPTPRLGQFLRGLALHLVRHYAIFWHCVDS